MLVTLWRGGNIRKTHTECRHRVAFDIRNKLTYKSDLHPSQVADLMGIRFTPKKANRNWLFLNGFWALKSWNKKFKSSEFSDPESEIQKMKANMLACWYFSCSSSCVGSNWIVSVISNLRKTDRVFFLCLFLFLTDNSRTTPTPS